MTSGRLPPVNPWLGPRRGYLTDWTTQEWVRRTGRLVALDDEPWLRGPSGPPEGIGPDYFERLAAAEGLALTDPADAGLIEDFAALRGEGFDPDAVRREVVDFYERTAGYRLHLWSHWSPAFRPFGRLVDVTFSRRLRQLQLPLAPLDTSRGVTSRLLRLRGGEGHDLTAWLRRRLPGGEVIYAGVYSVARTPLAAGPCVKVVFPLPNGNASVFLTPVARDDGSLELISAADRFGAPGFYFVVVNDDATVWTKHVPALTERIHVYADADAELHTDHVLRLWGRTFLRLHYAMTPQR
jgi:hypothetical protein